MFIFNFLNFTFLPRLFFSPYESLKKLKSLKIFGKHLFPSVTLRMEVNKENISKKTEFVEKMFLIKFSRISLKIKLQFKRVEGVGSNDK